MKVFVFSGLNSLLKEHARKRLLGLSEVQNCISSATNILKERFNLSVDFYKLAELDAKQIYSLENINLITTLVVCLQVGLSRALINKGIVPDILSAISLGDVARTIVSGAIEFDEAVQISNVNAEEKANLDRYGESVALFVNPYDPIRADDLDYLASLGIGVSRLSPRLANLSGSYESILKTRNQFKGRNWRIVHLLNYPFHSDVLQPYSHLMTDFLKKLNFTDPATPIFSTTFVRLIHRKQEILEEQIQTITKPHHWMKSVEVMTKELGAQEFFNIGPCQTLARAVRDIDANIKVTNAFDII